MMDNKYFRNIKTLKLWLFNHTHTKKPPILRGGFYQTTYNFIQTIEAKPALIAAFIISTGLVGLSSATYSLLTILRFFNLKLTPPCGLPQAGSIANGLAISLIKSPSTSPKSAIGTLMLCH